VLVMVNKEDQSPLWQVMHAPALVDLSLSKVVPAHLLVVPSQYLRLQ
jgi:hypothetical protein